MTADLVVELFAGPGGWDVAAHKLGLTVIGIEHDAATCRTRAAAGHLTVRADVAQYPPEVFAGKVQGLIASPPCPDFSSAGKRRGIEGESGRLIFEVPRWVEVVRPEWVACEQVPEALPYWRDFARKFKALGYFTWAGILCAADYGVPQERYRAILMCSTRGPVGPALASHAEVPHPSLLTGDMPAPWVSMAEGLGWGATCRTAPTVTGGGIKSGGPEPLARGGREALEKERGGG